MCWVHTTKLSNTKKDHSSDSYESANLLEITKLHCRSGRLFHVIWSSYTVISDNLFLTATYVSMRELGWPLHKNLNTPVLGKTLEANVLQWILYPGRLVSEKDNIIDLLCMFGKASKWNDDNLWFSWTLSLASGMTGYLIRCLVKEMVSFGDTAISLHILQLPLTGEGWSGKG